MRSILIPLLRWTRHLSGFTLAQIIIQGTAYFSGLVLVNFLSVKEYSLYTISVSGLTTLSSLSDMGILSVLAYFHRNTTEVSHRRAGQQACLSLRRRFVIVGTLIACPYLILQTINVGFSAATAVITVCVFLFVAAIGYSIPLDLMRLRLDGKFAYSYVLEGAINASKLAWVLVLYLFTLLSAPVAFAGVAVANGMGLVIARGYLDISRATDCDPRLVERFRREAWSMVRKNVPNALFFAAQGPFLVLLAGIFSKHEGIANIGALSRIALIFTVLSNFLTVVVMPKLANRIDNHEFLVDYLKAWAAILVGGVVLLLFCFSFPSLLLKLAGPNYAELTTEVRVLCLASVTLAWSGFATGVKHTRGWLRRQDVTLAVLVVSQVLLFIFIDFSNRAGVFYFQLGNALATLFIEIVNNLLGFLFPKVVTVISIPEHPTSSDFSGA